MEEYDPTESLRLGDEERVTRTTSVIAISQVKVLALSFEQFRRISKLSQNEEQKAKMHFFRTCHMDTFMGKMVTENQAGFQRILPLMNESSFGKGDIVVKQGDRAKNFYILKTGYV